jgi:hypothetical protein
MIILSIRCVGIYLNACHYEQKSAPLLGAYNKTSSKLGQIYLGLPDRATTGAGE